MVRRLLFSIIFLVFSLDSYGQNYPANQLKFSLSRLVWLPEPGLDFSYQRRTSERVAWQFTLGRPKMRQSRYEHKGGYTIALEPKLFLAKRPGPGKYLSLNLRHLDLKFRDILRERDTTGNQTIDSFTVRKIAQSLSLRFGKEWYIKVFDKPFVLDLSVGAGVKYRNISHIGRTIPYSSGPREIMDTASFFGETKGFAFIIPISLSFGYVF